MDEACSSVRVQLDSKPEAIDGMERQKVRLQVEEAALAKEKDPLSRARLEEVRRELAALEDALRPLAIKYGQERARLEELRRLQQKREQILVNVTIAEQHHNLARIADLKYGALPEVDEKLARLSAQPPSDAMLPEEVSGAAGRGGAGPGPGPSNCMLHASQPADVCIERVHAAVPTCCHR